LGSCPAREAPTLLVSMPLRAPIAPLANSAAVLVGAKASQAARAFLPAAYEGLLKAAGQF